MKITTKQFNGYKRAESEAFGVSANDNYNKAIYGITVAEYRLIDRAVHSLRGIVGPMPTLKEVNEQLSLMEKTK